ncbi:MAG: hypothetical protein A4S08_03870 [Proteobacteria bacterium SG_bin4]|nr:MAG: hypothetical protein A4S08_03870 [Proteobacteria bacterium SG_bin4]
MPVLSYSNFFQAAERKLSDNRNACGNHAVLTVNLGRLAELDGILGYAAVDQIIQTISKQLADALNPGDLIGITGRHQVSCLLVNLLANAHALLAAHKILRILTVPFTLGAHNILLNPCIGVAYGREKKSTIDLMMRNASLAIQQALQEKEQIKLFVENPEDTYLTQLHLWSDLNEAIETNALHLQFQPQFNTVSGKIESTEALLRWTHPQHGPIRTDKLIQVAEGTILMPKLTQWVLHTALRECSAFRTAGIDAGVSINFSADDLREPDIIDLTAQALDIWNVPPGRITVEVTETAVMETNRNILDTLNHLKDMGLKLSMDDFGTGYSSMSRMLELPLDEVKIDMIFVREMTKHPKHERIVDSIINLAHQLNLTVVAEGVEDLDTFRRLAVLGCDVIQGYLIGKPMPLTDFIKTVSQQSFEFLQPVAPESANGYQSIPGMLNSR